MLQDRTSYSTLEKKITFTNASANYLNYLRTHETRSGWKQLSKFSQNPRKQIMITVQTLQSISRANRAFCSRNPISNISKLSTEPKLLLPAGLPLTLGSLFSIKKVITMVMSVIIRNRSGLVPTNTLVMMPPTSRPQFERTTRKAMAMDAKKRLYSVADMAWLISCGLKSTSSFKVSKDQAELSDWLDWFGGTVLGLASISLLGCTLAAPS